MDMLERNYKTWCAQNDIILEDGPVEEGDEEMEVEGEDEWEGIMDIDEDEDELPEFFKEERARKQEARKQLPGAKRKKKGKVAELIRSKVKKVLEGCELVEKRARMCDQNDFLRMLEGFNEEGIHFA